MRSLLLLLAAAAPAALAPAQAPCRLHPLETSAGDFGGGLSVDGVRLAARAVDAQGSAVIEVWRRSGPTWTRDATLPPVGPVGQPTDDHGAVLDLQGDSLVVAAPFAQTGTSVTGELRPFREGALGWVAFAPLRPANTLAHVFADRFDRDGDRLVARASWYPFAGPESRLHVFQETATSWVELAEIPDPNPTTPGNHSSFGTGIALDGPWLAAGGPAQNGGHAYVWRRAQGGYTLLQELVPPGAVSPRYGEAVAVSADRIAVSDPGRDPGPAQGGFGVVHLFVRDATGLFTHTAQLTSPPLVGGIDFGASLDFVGNRLAATFRRPTTVSLLSLEALAIFTDVGTPAQREQLVLGALSGPDAPVGGNVRLARGEVLTTNRWIPVGNAQLFTGDLGRWTLDGAATVACPGAPNSTGGPSALVLAGCPAASGLTLDATGLPPGAAGVLLLGVAGPPVPVGQGTLCVGAPRRVDLVVADPGGAATGRVSPAGLGFAPGDVVRTQLWYRDGASSNLGTALAVELTE